MNPEPKNVGEWVAEFSVLGVCPDCLLLPEKCPCDDELGPLPCYCGHTEGGHDDGACLFCGCSAYQEAP